MSLDLEDIADFADEHKTWLIIGVCGLVIGANFALGGAAQLQGQMARQATDAAAKQAQQRAETLFFQQGCIAQAISQRTQTSNFVPGDIAIDPMSLTPENPSGTVINSGYLCSTDGSLFRTENGLVVELIGTSPEIRRYLVQKGFAAETLKVRDRVQQLYGGSANEAP